MDSGLEWARPAALGDLQRVGELWDRACHELGQRRGGRRLVLSSIRPSELDAGDRSAEGGVGAHLGHLEAPGSIGVGTVTCAGKILVVGGIDEVVLGFAHATSEPAGPLPVARLRALYVEDEARCVGIGEAMVEVVTEWAVEQGCAGIDAYALPGSRSAKAFFEDNGFVTRLLTMYRPLEDGGDNDDQ